MPDWTAGYVADLDYIYDCAYELNPLRARLALINVGQAPPEPGICCELGFGLGLSANLQAAASLTPTYGTDFNPSHARFAQECARAAEAGAQLFGESLAEFCARADLPDFEFVGVHGVWSWVSDENRRVVVDFVRRKLKPGGVLYLGYNAQPGWATMVPLRDVMSAHAEVVGAGGAGRLQRVESALAFAEQLLAVNPTFARVNPDVVERLSFIKEQDRHYLAHEYFNHDWQPMSFAQIAEWLRPARVQFAGSAYFLDAVDSVNLTPEQQALLQSLPDLTLRQTVRDFCVNQRFRRDYWIKGARSLTELEQGELLRAQRVVLGQARADVSLKFTAGPRTGDLNSEVYDPFLDVLADYAPHTLGELEQTLAPHGISFDQIREAVTVLIGTRVLHPAQDDATVAAVKRRTDRLNLHLMHLARSRGDLVYLASPVTAGPVPVGRFHQLFLLARAQGGDQPGEWARSAWQLFDSQRERLLRDGKVLESPEENLAELTARAQDFADRHLPVLVGLQIA